MAMHCLFSFAVMSAQLPEPDGGTIERGTLPAHWLSQGSKCMEIPEWQVHEYNPNFFILRQSPCTDYEKPFVFLFFGKDKALLADTGSRKVPRFLFNDIARYWRTMAVDFAYKQRTRPDGGFLLRNTKLRMSRKLLFLAGMVACFDCHLSFSSVEERKEFYLRKPIEAIICKLRGILSKPPLEIVASSLLPYSDYDSSIRKLFTAYDDFVGIPADEVLMGNGRTKREHLDELLPDDIQGDPVAGEAREISHRFRDAIAEIFLTPETPLGRLTIEYGCFDAANRLFKRCFSLWRFQTRA
jgi:hypothetical protein